MRVSERVVGRETERVPPVELAPQARIVPGEREFLGIRVATSDERLCAKRSVSYARISYPRDAM